MTSVRAFLFVGLVAGWFALMAVLLYGAFYLGAGCGFVALGGCLAATGLAASQIVPIDPDYKERR